ncbi:hypothetical protein HDU97_008103 [Phlyctochytrium planicorne]|nr:hypothetical protein HDU97_008103 [Phlyctochytrium planicorne]
MSTFRNFNQPQKSNNQDDDDDWRDEADYNPQKAPTTGTSIADRIGKTGQKIPVNSQAPAPQVVNSSYNTYDDSRSNTFSRPVVSATGYQPPAKPTYPFPTAATTAAAPIAAAAPPKPVKLTPAIPTRPGVQTEEASTPSNNPFVRPAPSPVAPSPAASSNVETITPSFSNNPFLKANASAPAAVPTPTASTPSYTPSRPSPNVTLAATDAYSNTSSGMGINSQALSQRFPHFSASEISAFHQHFASFDKDGKGAVHQADLSTVAPKAGEAYQNVVAKLSALRLSRDDGTVTFEGFLTAVSKLREEKGVGFSTTGKNKIVLHGQGGENTIHTVNEDEKQSFVEHINQQLANDKDLHSRLPIDVHSMQVFTEARDGLILAKLINDSVPNTIDERVLNVGKKLNAFQMTENNNVVVNSAKAIGCSVVNIGAQDLIEGREHLILGLIWQIIKIGLSAKIDIKFHPEIVRLLEPGETLEEFLKLPAEQILIRWFNYHLKKAGWHRKVNNFTSDIKDAENYTVLLNQLAPGICSRAPLQTSNLLDRAEQVLQNADRLGCRKYLSPKTMTEGNQKLNFAFVANLFNTHPGLEKLSDAEMAQLDDWLFSSEGSREARAFALWLNSLGVEPFVNNLFDDLQDGLVLLQAIDKVRPGIVEWKKVNKAPVPSKFKKVENTNYVLVLGKSLKFTLVGIQGSDITDGQKTLTLGFVWQLMREHVIQTLKSLSKSGVEITDSDIIQWANSAVKRGGKSSSISSFKDPQLRSGLYFLDLLNSLKKGIVNYELVDNGLSDDGAKMNAKYAISIARKLGATIFVLPEDIVEVKPKMILTFVGTLMALDRAGAIQN